MRRRSPPPKPKLSLQELGQSLRSSASPSPLFGNADTWLLETFDAMRSQGYELSEPQLYPPARPGHTTWRVDVTNKAGDFTGALLFFVPTLH